MPSQPVCYIRGRGGGAETVVMHAACNGQQRTNAIFRWSLCCCTLHWTCWIDLSEVWVLCWMNVDLWEMAFVGPEVTLSTWQSVHQHPMSKELAFRLPAEHLPGELWRGWLGNHLLRRSQPTGIGGLCSHRKGGVFQQLGLWEVCVCAFMMMMIAFI